MVDDSQDTTHFGFQTVAKAQKADMVAHVFHSVAAKYDVMNDLMSFGIHRLWKRFTIDCSGVRRGQTVLDLAGGTGDLTAKFSRLVGETGRVVLRVLIGTDGRVQEARIERSSGFDRLDQVALETARDRWRYRPGRWDRD